MLAFDKPFLSIFVIKTLRKILDTCQGKNLLLVYPMANKKRLARLIPGRTLTAPRPASKISFHKTGKNHEPTLPTSFL
jgi:hypothetical protein